LGLPGRAFVGDAVSIEQLTSQLSAAMPRIDDAAYEIVRLRRAVPRFGVDFDEHNYPQEVGLKALVSFKKGCYLGQEVVCTLENRGKLSRHLCVLEGASDAPAPVTGATPAADSCGTAPARASLYSSAEAQGADAAGALTSAVWDPEQRKAHVLAYVRRAHAVPGATLFVGTQPLKLVRLVGEDSV
jgi:folate-binding protein YgfZ